MKIEKNETRENEVFDFVKAEIQRTGKSPTMQTVADYIGAGAKSTAYYYMKRLTKSGKIVKDKRGYRLGENN